MEFFSKILGRTDAENNTFDSENNRSLKSPHSKLDISSEKLEVPVKDSENVLNVSDLARDLSDKLILGTPRQEASTKFNTNKWASPCRSANNSLLSDSGNNSLLSTSGTFSPSSDASFVTARDSSLTSNVCNSPGGDDIETIVLDKTIDLSSDSADSFNLTLDASIIPKAEPRSNKKSEGDDFEIVDIDCDKEDVKGKPTQQHSQESSEATESSEANDYIDSSVVSQDISYLSAEESISEEGTSRYASLENVYNTVIHYSQVDDYEVSVVGLNDITRASERGPNDNTRATEVSVLGLNDITRADYTVKTLSTTNVPDESNVDQFIEEISVLESVNKTALVDGKEQLLETSIQVEDSESLNSSSRTLNESIVNISTTSTNTESPELDEPIEVKIVSNDHENNFEQLEKHISEINLNSELSVEEIRAANLSKSLTVVSEPDPTGEANPDSNEQELVTKSIVESTQDASETFENLERSKADTVVSAETKPIEAIKEDSIVVPPEAALNPVTVDSKQEKQQESEVSENQIEPVVESEESSAEKVIETSSVEKLANETEVLSSGIKEKESIPSDQPAQSNSNSTEYQCEPLNLSIDNLKELNQESFEQSPVQELTETSAENESAVIVSKELTDPSLEKPSEQIAVATENQEPIESTVGDLNNTNETLNPVAEEEGLPNRDEKDLSTEETNFVAVTEEVTVQESDHKIVEESVQVDHPEKSSIQEVVQLKEVEIGQVAEDRQETKPFEVQEENSEPKLQAFEVEKTEESVKTDLENPESKVEATVGEKVEKSENLPVEVEKTAATDLEKPVVNSGEPTVDSGNLVIKQTVQQSESLPVVVEKTVETVQDDVQEVKQSKKEETVPIVSEEEKKISDIPPVPEPLTENKEVEPKELSAIEPQEILETTKTALESNINTQEIKVQEQVSEPEVPAPVIENVEKTNPDTVEVQEPIKTDLDKPESAVEHQIKPTNTEETKSSEAKEQLSEPEVKESVVEKKEVAGTISTGLDKPKPKVEEQVTEPEVQVSVVEKTQTVSFEVENPAKLTNPVTNKKTEITPLEVKKTNTAEQVKPTEQEAIVQAKAAETTEQEAIVQVKAAEITVQEAKDQVKAAEITVQEAKDQVKAAEISEQEAKGQVKAAETTEQEAIVQANAAEISSVESDTPISARDQEIPCPTRKSFPLEVPNSVHNDSLGEFELIESQLSSDQAEEEKRLSERIVQEPAEVSSELLDNVIPDGLMEDESLNKSEAGPDTAEISKEEFQSSEEWFKNPGSFDFLEQASSRARIAESELRKQSLYVKFDPLLQSPIRQRPSVKSLTSQTNIMEEDSLNDSKPISELNDSVTNLSESPNVSSVPSQISNVSPNVSTVSCQPDAAGDASASKGAEIEKLKQENALFQKMLNDYENTITQCVNQREADKKQFEKYKKELERDKEEAQLHLRNSEIAFNDVHQKYERSRAIIEGMKANEDELKARQSEMEEELKKQNNKYDVLKNHAISQLEKANQDLELRMKTNEVEQAKLKAMLKKSEMHITSLQESLARKTQENAELTSICDDLLSKLGVNA